MAAEWGMIMEMRIEEHPILGVQEKGKEVIFFSMGRK